MKQQVNYIIHQKNINLKMVEDNSIYSTHISLYNALFQIWNECGFDTELSINRNDVMKLSKIGSANTYTKCLKQLDKLGYIKYKPSYNPLVGSKVEIYRFDKGTDKGTGKSSSKGTDKGCDTLYKLLNKETIKLINKHFDIINLNIKKWIDQETKNKEQITNNNFLTFWNFYHKITGMNKTDKVSAEKYWEKLTKVERKKAIDNIKSYYDSIDNKKYIKKARTYLSDKNFNDEFKTKNPYPKVNLSFGTLPDGTINDW